MININLGQISDLDFIIGPCLTISPNIILISLNLGQISLNSKLIAFLIKSNKHGQNFECLSEFCSNKTFVDNNMRMFIFVHSVDSVCEPII